MDLTVKKSDNIALMENAKGENKAEIDMGCWGKKNTNLSNLKWLIALDRAW